VIITGKRRPCYRFFNWWQPETKASPCFNQVAGVSLHVEKKTQKIFPSKKLKKNSKKLQKPQKSLSK
jgi:hypothetical protein